MAARYGKTPWQLEWEIENGGRQWWNKIKRMRQIKIDYSPKG